MDSEDDPRSIDWAPEKIGQLDEQIQRISENMTTKMDALTDRVFDLERRREEADRTIAGLRGERTLERITALENGSRLVGTGNLVDDLIDRIKRLESQTEFENTEDDAGILDLRRRVLQLERALGDHASDVVKAVWSETVRQLDEDTIPQFGAPWSADEDVEPQYSAPIGGLDPRYPVKTDAERHGGVFSVELGVKDRINEAYRRGLAAGADKALENAARRLRQRMATEGWAPHFVDRLTKLVRGFGPIEDPEIEATRHRERGHAAALDEAETRIRAYMGTRFSTRTIEGVLAVLRGSQPNSENGVQ